MKITLIGMSTVGKSYWSDRFVEAGFERLDLDGMIKERFENHLGSPQTYEEMGEWLGFPENEGFGEREQQLKQIEAAVLRDVTLLLKTTDKKRLIIDTGGSLVYAPPQYWHNLKQFVKIVYLKMDKKQYQGRIDLYLQTPRFMLWNGQFQPNEGESRYESYLRCYANLLAEREQLYEKYADCALAYEVHRNPAMTVNDFIDL